MLRCEEDALVAADFEEIFQHAHVQRLAKPARTREQINLSPVRHQIDDQSSFIYIIEILLPYFFIFQCQRVASAYSLCPPLFAFQGIYLLSFSIPSFREGSKIPSGKY